MTTPADLDVKLVEHLNSTYGSLALWRFIELAGEKTLAELDNKAFTHANNDRSTSQIIPFSILKTSPAKKVLSLLRAARDDAYKSSRPSSDTSEYKTAGDYEKMMGEVTQLLADLPPQASKGPKSPDNKGIADAYKRRFAETDEARMPPKVEPYRPPSKRPGHVQRYRRDKIPVQTVLKESLHRDLQAVAQVAGLSINVFLQQIIENTITEAKKNPKVVRALKAQEELARDFDSSTTRPAVRSAIKPTLG